MINNQRIDLLEKEQALPKEDWMILLSTYTEDDMKYAATRARAISNRWFGNRIYTRGIIEFSNFCKNDCLYCGIRRSNPNVCRYRLAPEEIISCVEDGYALGFRTIVLQSGEDLHYTDDLMTSIIREIKARHPDCAITLSIGEKPAETYQRYFEAGADRYLLRHETADPHHYAKLHPASQTLEDRMRCLNDLKKTGFQTGCGIMVGTPFQTVETLATDMRFMSAFRPEMVGIGPFIPHHETPFKDSPAGSVRLTLLLLSLVRIMLPHVLMPATTALGTAQTEGRALGVLAGANVVMPNLSPMSQRKKYLLYDNKLGTDDEAEESMELLRRQMDSIGYALSTDRGDYSESETEED